MQNFFARKALDGKFLEQKLLAKIFKPKFEL